MPPAETFVVAFLEARKMPDDFDPYYLWLGIPPQERPASHYRLLGISLFESNPSVIESAADRQMASLRSVQAGEHSGLSQRLLNEVAAAKVCLLRAPQKAKYDQALRAKLETQSIQPSSAAPVQPATAMQARPTSNSGRPASGSESFWEEVDGNRRRSRSGKTRQATPTRRAGTEPNKTALAGLCRGCMPSRGCRDHRHEDERAAR